MLSVNPAFAWPSHLETWAILRPRSKSREAQVCLSVWKLAHSTPAAEAAGIRASRLRLESENREPVRVAKRG